MFFELTLGLVSVGVVVIITLWALVVVIRDRKKKRAEQEHAELAAQDRAKNLRWNLEEKRRTFAREQWLRRNKLCLYFNIIDDITVVMTRDEHEQTVQRTSDMRLDGKWAHEHLLMPAPNGFVFVTVNGRRNIDERTADTMISHYKVAGTVSELRKLVKFYDIECVRDLEIFVPWVNQKYVSFCEQARCTVNGASRTVASEIILKQFPRGIWPQDLTD